MAVSGRPKTRSTRYRRRAQVGGDRSGRHAASQRALRPARLPDRGPGGDHAGVEADGVQAAEEAGVLDLDATVLDHVEAGGDLYGSRREMPTIWSKCLS